MTIHSSKGLEFNSVFIVGVERGYYPIYHPSIKDKKNMKKKKEECFMLLLLGLKGIVLYLML